MKILNCVLLAHLFVLPSMLERSPAMARTTAASDEECCGVGRPIILQGDANFNTYSEARNLQISGADNPVLFREEVYGKDFSVVIPGLLAGKYTIEIEAAETYATGLDVRVMNITAGTQKIAENFDIFARAGGFGKVTTLAAVVSHPGDAAGGALAIRFQAVKQENAKFNFIRVKDDKGALVASAYASQLRQGQDRAANTIPIIKAPSIVFDATRPRAARIADLISRMSLSEKVAQLHYEAPAIERLKVPSYVYWNEALHGIARNGRATVFPQAIGLAATWDVDLIGRVADAISTEGRAKYAEAQSKNSHERYQGLTFWSPNINIFRDPRWGRGQETYGEDPFLTSRIAVAFIRGLQGNDPSYLKTIACAKHFAAHSGPEPERHSFDAKPSQQDLHDTYLPAFEAAVKEGKVMSVMSAYNALNGVPAPANAFLLQDNLRGRWGFGGHVVSDDWAVSDVYTGHGFVSSFRAAAVASLKAGTDLETGNEYRYLASAVPLGLVTEAEVDTVLSRVLDARFRLGLFDPPAQVKWTKIGANDYDTPQNAQLALQSARKSLVLLKNEGVLPLNKARIKKLAVIGDNADSIPVLLGNYNGDPSHPITILQGLKNKIGAERIVFVPGVRLAMKAGEAVDPNNDEFRQAIAVAQGADAVIYVGGLNAALEGEQMPVDYVGFHGGDRTAIELPAGQNAMLQALQATGKPLVFVNCSGSAVAMPWAAENVPAIVQAWYPGQAGGMAVADVLFGDADPGGRLPITFYRATSDLPDISDYNMKGRTYRYFSGKPLWAFGHGLSYTKFSYGKPAATARTKSNGLISVKLALKNDGKYLGDEVVQIYARPLFADARQPRQRLIGFVRVAVGVGKTAPVQLSIPAARLRIWDTAKNDYRVVPGRYELGIGGASDDIRAKVTLEVQN